MKFLNNAGEVLPLLKHITTISFSPTGQTEQLVRAFGQALAGRFQAEGITLSHMSFTLPEGQKELRTFGPDTLVVFGTPTYAGRIPNKALPFVQQLFAGDPDKKTPAVALVTFGNRAYDSSLTELRDELEKKNFRVFAGGAFACAHAFAAIGEEHPTAEDKGAFETLVTAVEKALRSEKPLETVTIGDNAPVAPYYIPMGEDGQPAKFLKAKPKTDLTKCDHCGKCATVCPMGSINPENTDEVPGICIKCQACIKYCPKGAKYFDDPRFLSHKAMLEKNYKRTAKSDIFIESLVSGH